MEEDLTNGGFSSSKLGTKEYWDLFYKKELENFQDNNEDEGEVWFGHTRMMKVVKYLVKNENVTEDSSILDIGCGNGAFLLEMADEGYKNLYGIDYSHTAISLSQNTAAHHNKHIRYKQSDFLNRSTILFEDTLQFDVCHDKGTYDAISLRPDDAETARNRYIQSLLSVMKDGALFVITSCNWTLDEIKSHFGTVLSYVDFIPSPTFQYGGKTGNTVATAVFIKT